MSFDLDNRPSDGRLLSLDAVAACCGVSSKTVRRWIDRDNLPIHRLPGTGIRSIVRISEDDLNLWLQARRHDPEVEKANEQVMVLDGMRFMQPSSSETKKSDLDTSRRFWPRVKNDTRAEK